MNVFIRVSLSLLLGWRAWLSASPITKHEYEIERQNLVYIPSSHNGIINPSTRHSDTNAIIEPNSQRQPLGWRPTTEREQFSFPFLSSLPDCYLRAIAGTLIVDCPNATTTKKQANLKQIHKYSHTYAWFVGAIMVGVISVSFYIAYKCYQWKS